MLYRNGVAIDLKDNDLVEVVIVGDSVEIRFKNPQQADTGKWAMELSNSGGTVLAPFELFVRAKPKPPKGFVCVTRLFYLFFCFSGPLEVSNITANSADLKWKAPEDDGGVPVKAYLIEMQEDRSGLWVKVAETKTTEFKVCINVTEFYIEFICR